MADDRWPDGTLRVPPSLGLEFQPFTSAFSAHVGYSVYASEKRDFEQLCVSKLGQKPGSVVKSIAGSMIHRLKSGTLHQVAVGTRRDCSVLDMDIRVLNQRGDELLILRDPEFRQENVVTVHLISGDLSQVFHAGYEDGAPFAKALVVATALEGVQLDLKPQMPQLPPKYADMKVRVICEGSSDFVQLSTAGSVRATTKVPVAYVKLKEVDAVVSYRWDAKKMRVWDPSGTSLAWEGVAATNALNQMIRDKRKIWVDWFAHMGDPATLQEVLAYMGTLYACKPVIHTMLMLSDAKQLDRAWIQQEQAVLGIDVTTMSKLSVRGRTHLFVLGEPSIRPQAVWGFSNKYKFEKEDGVKKALGILEKKSTPKNMMQIIAINQFKNVTNRSDLPFALYSTLAAALKTSIEECPQILLRECGSVPYCEMEGFRNPSYSFPYHWYHQLVASNSKVIFQKPGCLVYACQEAIEKYGVVGDRLGEIRTWIEHSLAAAQGHRCDWPIDGLVCLIFSRAAPPNVGCGNHFMAEYDHQSKFLVIINRSSKVHALCNPLKKS